MSALAIIECFDVIEDLGASLGAGVKDTAINQFQFESGPEAFHGGVVIAVAPTAHGGDQAGLNEGLTIIATGVLDAAIGMTEQLGRRAAMEQRQGQRVENQRRVDMFAHGPADDFAAVEVQDGRQVKPAFLGLDIGEVGHPELVGRGGLGRLGQAIGGNGLVVVAVGGLDAIAALLAAAQTLFLQESSDAVASMAASFFAQLPMDTKSTVGLAAARMNLVDLLGQRLIFQCAGTGLSLALFPVVEACRRSF